MSTHWMSGSSGVAAALPPAKYVKPKAAEAHFGVDRRTLRKWADAGHIRFFQPGESAQRLYDISSTGGVALSTASRKAVKGTVAAAAAVGSRHRRDGSAGDVAGQEDAVDAVYARVSTRKQLDDLDRQLATLKTAHPDAVVFTDCASGLNFKRKGFVSLLQLAFEGRLRCVYVSHKDRLCRFAFDLVEHVLAKHGAKIVVESQDVDATSPSFEQDLADDIISVVTVFGARLYGRRSGQGRKRKRAAEQQAAEEGGDGVGTTVAGSGSDSASLEEHGDAAGSGSS